ncbi:MAG: carboxypeptidase-like regulatory domain-containing protein, partial [Bryobacteraceae bacterium]
MYSLYQRLFYSAAFLTVLFSFQLHGQTLGTFTGEIKDSSGAAIAGAAITVTNTATNGIRVATTNEDGLYTIPALVPGMYQVKAEKAGFKGATRTGIELQVQQTARIDFGLEVGQVSETIEVSASAALLTTENATVGTVIEQKRITDLPLNGRNFLSLVALSPNVTFGFQPPAQAAG